MQNSAATTIWSRLSSGLSCFGPPLVVQGTCLATWLPPADSFGHQQEHCCLPQKNLSIDKDGVCFVFFSITPLTAKVCRYCSPPKESAIVKMAFISYCGVVCWGKMENKKVRMTEKMLNWKP